MLLSVFFAIGGVRSYIQSSTPHQGTILWHRPYPVADGAHELQSNARTDLQGILAADVGQTSTTDVTGYTSIKPKSSPKNLPKSSSAHGSSDSKTAVPGGRLENGFSQQLNHNSQNQRLSASSRTEELFASAVPITVNVPQTSSNLGNLQHHRYQHYGAIGSSANSLPIHSDLLENLSPTQSVSCDYGFLSSGHVPSLTYNDGARISPFSATDIYADHDTSMLDLFSTPIGTADYIRPPSNLPTARSSIQSLTNTHVLSQGNSTNSVIKESEASRSSSKPFPNTFLGKHLSSTESQTAGVISVGAKKRVLSIDSIDKTTVSSHIATQLKALKKTQPTATIASAKLLENKTSRCMGVTVAKKLAQNAHSLENPLKRAFPGGERSRTQKEKDGSLASQPPTKGGIKRAGPYLLGIYFFSTIFLLAKITFYRKQNQ